MQHGLVTLSRQLIRQPRTQINPVAKSAAIGCIEAQSLVALDSPMWHPTFNPTYVAHNTHV